MAPTVSWAVHGRLCRRVALCGHALGDPACSRCPALSWPQAPAPRAAGACCASPQQCGRPWLPAFLVFMVMISSVEPNWSSLEIKLAVVLKRTSVDCVLQAELGWLGWALLCLVVSCLVTSWCKILFKNLSSPN